MKRSQLALLVTLLYGFSFNGLIATVLPLYLRDRGVSIAEIGVIFSAYYFVMQFLRVLVGAVADRVGNRNLIRASGLVQAFSVLIYYFSPYSSLYLIGKILEGVSASIVRAMDMAILYSGAMQEKMDFGKAAGRYSFYLWIGVGLGSFVAGYLVGFGYAYAFGLALLLSLAFAALSRFEPEKRRQSLNGVLSHAFDWRRLGKRLKRLAVIRTLEGVGWTLTTSFLLVIILKEYYGLDAGSIGFVLLLIYVVRALSGHLFGRFAHIIDDRQFFASFSLLSAATSALAGAAIAFGAGFFAFALAILANVVLSGMKAPAINKMIVISANKRELGKEISLGVLGYGIGMGLGDAFSGALAGYGGFALPYYLGALAQFVLAWAIWKFA